MAQPNPSVYVGNLDPTVTEPMLFDLLKGAGNITSIRVCTDTQTQRSLCYAYVNFQNPADAEKAIEQYSGTKLASKPIRVCRVIRDPLHRRQAIANIYIKNIPKDIDGTTLRGLFSKFGKIISIHIPQTEGGEGRGYAYVDFEKEDSAVAAVGEINGQEFEGKSIVVERYKVQQHEAKIREFKNLYIKANLKKTVTEDELKEFFSKYGKVTSVAVRRDGSDQPTGNGYVAYEDHESAVRAIEGANEQICSISEPDKPISICRFQSRSERLRAREKERREKQLQNAKYPNLYVRNFSEDITAEKLKELFETVGETVSVRVMVDPATNISRCFGFVSMKNAEAADKAIQKYHHNVYLGDRPLFVTHALRKDARRAALDEQQKKTRNLGPRFQQPQMPFPGMGPGIPGPMNIFGQPGMGPLGLNFPMRPPGQMRPMPGPMMHQSQPMMGMPPNRMPPPQPRPVPQRLPTGPGFPPMQQQPLPQQQPQLSTLLASMGPEQQKNVLGERLYGIIQRQHPNEAAKVTGMLLEMDNGEILNLLDSPEQLNAKVNEALEVLERHSGN